MCAGTLYANSVGAASGTGGGCGQCAQVHHEQTVWAGTVRAAHLSPNYSLIVYRCFSTRTHSPHPYLWPGRSISHRGTGAQGHSSSQGLTLVHYSAQRKHVLWDNMGLWVELVTKNGSG